MPSGSDRTLPPTKNILHILHEPLGQSLDFFVVSSMTQRSYSERRDSKSKPRTVIMLILAGSVTALIGAGITLGGLETCTFFECHTEYGVVAFGIVFSALSVPMFLLAWKTYERPEETVTVRDVREVVMIPCAYCRSMVPQASLFCPNCGASRRG